MSYYLGTAIIIQVAEAGHDRAAARPVIENGGVDLPRGRIQAPHDEVREVRCFGISNPETVSRRLVLQCRASSSLWLNFRDDVDPSPAVWTDCPSTSPLRNLFCESARKYSGRQCEYANAQDGHHSSQDLAYNGDVTLRRLAFDATRVFV